MDNTSVLVVSGRRGFETALARRFADAGAAAESCPPERVREYLAKSARQAVFMPVSSGTAPVLAVMREFPDTAVFPLVYSFSEEAVQELIDAGACMCFIMPADTGEIVRLTMPLIGAGDSPVRPEISRYLEDRGIKSGTSGFACLGTAIELCMTEPDLLNELVGGLYVRTAERLGSRPELVERSIRHIARCAAASGAYSNIVCMQTDYIPTCRELICACADGIVRGSVRSITINKEEIT